MRVVSTELFKIFWSTYSIWVLLNFPYLSSAEGNAQPRNNREDFPGHFYTSNYQNYRRGYGMRKNPNFSQYGSSGGQAGNFQNNFESFSSSATDGRNSQRRSISNRHQRSFGGPDAFLSSDPDTEILSKTQKIGNSNRDFRHISHSSEAWSKQIGSKGRSKGGLISPIETRAFHPKPTHLFRKKGNSRLTNTGSRATSFNTRSMGSAFQSKKFPNTKTNFGGPVKSFNNPSKYFNSFQNRGNSRLPFTSDVSNSGASTVEESFSNSFTDSNGEQFNAKEHQSNLEDKNSFEALKSIYGKFEDLTDGNLVGPLSDIKDLGDIAALLAQFESVDAFTTTTKKPNRMVAMEDKDKIFNGEEERTLEEGEKNGIFGTHFNKKNIEKESYSKSFRKDILKSMNKISNNRAECNTPETPMNAELKCSSNGCRLDCHSNFRTILGDTRLYFACIDGRWITKRNDYQGMPDCEPICDPPCQNQGICLTPNVCDCPNNWDGPRCEVSKAKKCTQRPSTPSNTQMFCSKEECIARCIEGYKLDHGLDKLIFECKDGVWAIAESQDSVTDEPICKAVCDPECQNGGVCLAPDLCECSTEYRGPQCQYPVSNCDAKKLGFNGGYNCSGKNMDYGCTLWCPDGVEFSFKPADRYTCDFSTGNWSPLSLPKCVYKNENSEAGTNIFRKKSSHHADSEGVRGGRCLSWSDLHYKSFSGKVFSFKSICSYTLLQDAAIGTFSLNMVAPRDCKGNSCSKTLNIFIEGDHYVLGRNENYPILTFRDTSLAIPGQINGIITERVAHYVVLKMNGIGLTLKWDMETMFEVHVSSILWNRTSGLCGNLGGNDRLSFNSGKGHHEEDYITFLGTSQASTIGEPCQDAPIIKNDCSTEIMSEANSFCSQLMEDNKFVPCKELLDVEDYIAACQWDYCNCKDEYDRASCTCNTFNAYFKECSNMGVEIDGGWRSQNLCPMKCMGDLEYNACMPAIPARCGQATDMTEPEFCVEGCDCLTGLVLNNRNKCIQPEECPCSYHNKTYSSGAVLPNDCNTCTCISGEWVCTEVKCGARCSSVGDPHYTTFDGRKYDFMGQCSYYLVKGSDFSIEAENIACTGAISAALNLPSSIKSQLPSCTHSLTIRSLSTTVHLKQNNYITINGEEIVDLPLWTNDIFIKRASSLFVIVSLPNGVDVWWDGQTRAYIDAPPDLRGQTSGLCGTFNDNQKDDFFTPEGDNEQDPRAFANKWKTSQKCFNVPLLEEAHPCDRHAQNKELAETYCTKIKSSTFADCHLEVDPESFYRDCLYDMCSCEADVKNCVCPILAAYGKECARVGVIVDWRARIRECGLHCTGGQTYQICGNSCSRTCYDLSTNPNCNKRCVEGCNCPEGFTLDVNKKCIPISECPCVYRSQEFKPDYEMFQTNSEGSLEICNCKNTQWECRQPTVIEENSPQFFTEPQMECLEEDNVEYTNCLSEEEPTCLTMHLHREKPSDLCRPGCRCIPGFVRSTNKGTCVPYTSCPCHHGGKSYKEGQAIREECNQCICTEGLWSCTSYPCPAICSAWGDSHFKTFDGRIFDFHGTCDYMLVKGRRSRIDMFEISLQNMQCGTSGVTCAKSLTLKVGTGGSQEVIEFSRNKPTPFKSLTRTIIREAGVFTFAEVTDMGLVVQWDKGTRVYVVLDPSWQNERVQGLCGNYNGDEKDDFKTPSGGGGEVSAKIFGDSWRLQNYCPEGIKIEDTCSLHPYRKLWASENCATLKSSVFYPCHSEVPVEPYVERCEFDACGCDTGGDCHCLCTAIAAYAHECSIHGVYIKWRKPKFCPMQCDESCERYEACIPTCPSINCESYREKHSTLCYRDTCVEGCARDICPPGQIHNSTMNKTCVPISACDRKCMEIDGYTYLEGAVITEDDCHTCFCTKGKKLCQGSPCETTFSSLSTISTSLYDKVTTPETLTTTSDEDSCRSGWTIWINDDHPNKYHKNSDIEPIPDFVKKSDFTKGYCGKNWYESIRCRTVSSHRNPDKDVSCNLEDGLRCEKSEDEVTVCEDYEISLLCSCVKEHTDTFEGVQTTTSHYNYTDVRTLLPQTTDSMLSDEACPSDKHFEKYAIKCSKVCHFYRNILINHDLCLDDENWAPACVDDLTGLACPPEYFLRDKVSCVKIFDCNCVLPNGISAPPERQYLVADCEICKCSNNQLLCDNSRCYDVPVQTTELTAEFTTKPPHSLIKIKCDDWSPWLNMKRTSEGDFQRISDLRIRYEKLCQTPVNISCRDAEAKLPASDLDQIITCSISEGLICRNIDNNVDCYDYEVSFFCKCDISHTTEERPLTPLTTPMVVTESVPCVGYSPWINEHTPFSEDGDTEFKTLEQLRMSFSFCLEGNISSIECLESSSGLDISVSKDVQCNMEYGLSCKNRNQPSGFCHDFKIRYYCSCGSTVTTRPAIITPTVPTQPSICSPENFIDLSNSLDDSAFSATSSLSTHFGPSQARINSGDSNDSAWIPKISDKNQFLQINLGNLKTVFGIRIAGSVRTNERVTSFSVQTSDDEIQWNPVSDELFNGPSEQNEKKLILFESPAQARYIRFLPNTWTEGIGMRVEIVGCLLPTSIPTATMTSIKPLICDEPMGLENGLMADDLISVSSVFNGMKFFYGGQHARLNNVAITGVSAGAWVADSSNEEFIRFDFIEARRITGIVTQGRPGKKEFVRTFLVKYSPDSVTWISIMDSKTGEPKVFNGNYDDLNPVYNTLGRIIEAQCLEIRPLTWNVNIALRVEIKGCFIPYPKFPATLPLSTTTLKPPPPDCLACPSLPVEFHDACHSCPEDLVFDGEKCVPDVLCPCYHNGMKYDFGTIFETSTCEKCVCEGNEKIKCNPLECDPCSHENEKAVLTPSCNCICKPCPKGTILCPSCNYCLAEEKWCDGIEHCTDDELDCALTSTPGKTELQTSTTEAPKIWSPPVCIVKDRFLRTFDGTELKVETCVHILARDKLKNEWQISIHQYCSQTHCEKYAKVLENEDALLISQNLKVTWNNYTYSISQAQIIGQSMHTFSIYKIGNAIQLNSFIYKYELLISGEFNIKIKLDESSIYQVDGLCGLFSRSTTDDLAMPEGVLAASTSQFTNSWAISTGEEHCKTDYDRCSPVESKRAFTLCEAIELKPFMECHEIISPSLYLKECIDHLCKCLKANKTEEECRCGVLASYVTSCLEYNSSVNVVDWQISNKCYNECPPGEVYEDCFQAACEPTCENIEITGKCPEIERNTCLSGCFCKPGLIRSMGKCVPPEICRNCICEGYGDPHFKSFDGKNFTLTSDCSFVAVRDRSSNGQHQFEVLLKNEKCPHEPKFSCIKYIEVLYNKNRIIIGHEFSFSTLTITIGDGEIIDFPFREPWITIEKPDENRLAVLLTDIQLEIVYIKDNYGFIIKLPSHLYSNKLEGICGNCNFNSSDDFLTNEGVLIESLEKFGANWVLNANTGEKANKCEVFSKNYANCTNITHIGDPCSVLLNKNSFRKCHALVNPLPYISSCQRDVCHATNVSEVACHSIEAYARRCSQLGLCLNWRSNEICPKECSKGRKYQQCGSGCHSTCSNFNENDDSCVVSPIDGCYCPKGKVLLDNECVNKSRCVTCDDEGHRVGDVWKTDSCTSCQCTEEGIAVCKSRACPLSPVCNKHYVLEEVPESEDECCGAKRVCKLRPLKNCSEPVKPEEGCSFGKKLILIETPGVCPEYACVCLEPHNCPEVEVPADDKLKPGEQWELDKKGCCPQYVVKCTSNCPTPQCSEKYYKPNRLERNDQCCPEYVCEPPTDACIYQPQYTIENGFEIPVAKNYSQEKLLYEVGMTWNDGFCIECECHSGTESSAKPIKESESSKFPSVSCLKKSCQEIDEHEDKENYVLEGIVIPNSCCAKIIRTACIDDKRVFKANETIKDPLNACRSIECKVKETSAGKGLEKVEQIFSCDETCALGFRYSPSPLFPQVCCGECQAVSCVYNGEIMEPGDLWYSSDRCTEFECLKDEKNKIQTLSKIVQCSIPTEEELKLYRFAKLEQKDECCPVYTKEACLIHEKVIEVGQELTDPRDKCIKIQCEKADDGEINRRERETACNLNCPLGHIYVPAPKESEKCCGRCLQTQCVDSDKIYNIGETWENPKENCYQYTCRMKDEDLNVVAVRRTCPYFDPECPADKIIEDESGCCELCNITRETKKECQAEEITPEETIGTFVVEAPSVGKCTNPNPVHGFKRCRGQCDSKTEFKAKGIESRHLSICECCKPSRSMLKISVQLKCTKGYSFTRFYDNIEACSCQACGEDAFNQYVNDQPIQDLTQFIIHGENSADPQN